MLNPRPRRQPGHHGGLGRAATAAAIVIPSGSAFGGLSQNGLMTRAPRQDLRPGVSEPVVLMISRREVDSGDLASVLARLKVFLATREDAWRYRGQMTLVVDGYNNDPRELVDILEVRTLLRRLEAEWPYWAFFFNQVDDSIKLLLSCVAGSRYLGNGAVEMDGDLVAAAMTRAFGGMNAVFERFNFPEDELELMSRGFVEVLQQAGMG
jgi:hypothetical protein